VRHRSTFVSLCCAALAAAACCAHAGAAQLRDVRPLMGTVVEIAAEGPDEHALATAVGAAYREMARLSDMMNHYDPASVVARINAAAGTGAVPVPPELMEVLAMARRLSARSDGAFDVTVGALSGWRFRPGQQRVPPPEEIERQRARVDWRKLVLDERAGTVSLAAGGMRIDLGGIAKLYILDAGLKVLVRHGATRALLNGGGDVLVQAPAGGRPWRVGVRDPRAPERLLGLVEIARGFVASSGDYERAFVHDGQRYHHILDPRTGWPAQGPRGVTVIGEDLAAVNGLSVAIMVLGKDAGIRLLRATPGAEALIVDRDGSVWMSAGFRARFRPVE
jgi:thiamine biosynthesis lipoprotein